MKQSVLILLTITVWSKNIGMDLQTSKEDRTSWTALHQAAYDGNVELIDTLLASIEQNEINTQTKSGETALNLAARGHLRIITNHHVSPSCKRGCPSINKGPRDPWQIYTQITKEGLYIVRTLLEHGAELPEKPYDIFAELAIEEVKRVQAHDPSEHES